MTELTTFDKALLNLLQGNLPVCSRPFAELAARCELSLVRMKRLSSRG